MEPSMIDRRRAAQSLARGDVHRDGVWEAADDRVGQDRRGRRPAPPRQDRNRPQSIQPAVVELRPSVSRIDQTCGGS
jgi:hypothetical protein